MWFCAASGSPSGVPVLSDFRCSQGVSLLVRSYRVLLSLLSFLRFSVCCSASPGWAFAGLCIWRYDCVALEFCVTIILSFLGALSLPAALLECLSLYDALLAFSSTVRPE